MTAEPFDLLLPFDRDSTEFVRGVEVGMTWARLAEEPRPFAMVAHVDNAEMMLRIAEAYGLCVTATETDGDWLELTFS